ncbi:MAG TPA: aminopeptidase P N-terminal domain-containing protein [Humisphaera sp.]
MQDNGSARAASLYFQTDFDAGEFARRRNQLMDAVGGRGVALLAGAPEVPGFDPFRQSNDFYYLCGVEVPHAYLLIDAGRRTSTLYLPTPNRKHEASDGPTLGPEDAAFVRERAGVEDVRPVAALPQDLAGAACVHLPRAPAEGVRMCQDTLRHARRSAAADPMGAPPSPEVHLLARVAELCPGAELRDLSPILQRMRLVKSDAEVAVMRRAGRLAAEAVVAAMRVTRPGVFEYELAAAADHVYLLAGSRGGAYRPIIAGGANIPMMHYWRNNCRLRAGDLVLMDYAPDVGNYTSDIGRMWPVDGRYTPAHRELYGFVIEYHRLLLSVIRGGRVPEDVLAEAAERMRPRADAWPFSKPLYRESVHRMLASPRPLSHGVGMAVHEAAGYFGRPMEPGLVIAVDPELFVPEERLYIRCEDTVVVTAGGCENLTADAPLEMDAVERLMAGTVA